jgi:hypothetical protein
MFALKDLSNQAPPKYKSEESSLEPSCLVKWDGWDHLFITFLILTHQIMFWVFVIFYKSVIYDGGTCNSHYSVFNCMLLCMSGSIRRYVVNA